MGIGIPPATDSAGAIAAAAHHQQSRQPRLAASAVRVSKRRWWPASGLWAPAKSHR